MFGLGGFWDKSSSGILKMLSFYSGNFQDFQKCTRAIYRKSPSYFPYFNVICCFIPQRFFKALPKNYHQVYYHCNTRVILFYEIRVEQTRWKWTSSLTISNQTPISYSINVSRPLHFKYFELHLFKLSKKTFAVDWRIKSKKK